MSGLSCARMSAKSPLALHAQRREFGDVHRPAQSSRCLISSHDRSPPLEAPAHRPFVRTSTHDPFSLYPFERELQVALLQRRVHVVDLGRPGAAVPQHDDAGAVAGGDDAFELAVLDRVILDVHRQPLGRRVERRSLGHRPGEQHAVVLQAEVVVEVAGQVLLDAEEARRAARRGAVRVVARRLGRLREVALALVVVERHRTPVYARFITAGRMKHVRALC